MPAIALVQPGPLVRGQQQQPLAVVICKKVVDIIKDAAKVTILMMRYVVGNEARNRQSCTGKSENGEREVHATWRIQVQTHDGGGNK